MAKAGTIFKYLFLFIFINLIISSVILYFLLSKNDVQPQTIIQSTPETITVLTYNIHYGEGLDGEYNLNRIINLIKDISPDFICLNGVDNKAVRTFRDDQARKIAAAFGMKFTFSRNHQIEGGWHGNAILSRYPIQYVENKFLQNSDGTESRSLLHAILKTGQRNVHIYCTELSENSLDSEKQVEEIIEYTMKQGVEEPVVIAGDFNLPVSNQYIEEMKYYFKLGTDKFMQEKFLTYPAQNPSEQYDYLFFNQNLILLSTEVIDNSITRIASSHLPIFSKFRMK